jgi:hypothetical protein
MWHTICLLLLSGDRSRPRLGAPIPAGAANSVKDIAPHTLRTKTNDRGHAVRRIRSNPRTRRGCRGRARTRSATSRSSRACGSPANAHSAPAPPLPGVGHAGGTGTCVGCPARFPQSGRTADIGRAIRRAAARPRCPEGPLARSGMFHHVLPSVWSCSRRHVSYSTSAAPAVHLAWPSAPRGPAPSRPPPVRDDDVGVLERVSVRAAFGRISVTEPSGVPPHPPAALSRSPSR